MFHRRRPSPLFANPYKADRDPPKRQRPRGLRAWAIGVVRRFIILIGVLIVISVALCLLAKQFDTGGTLADDSRGGDKILVLHLRDGLAEEIGGDGLLGDLQGMNSDKLSVRDMLDALHIAARDRHVKALIVTIDSGDFGAAKVEELREGIKEFRASGKPAYAYSASYAEAGGTMGAYYLASAFDQIWMQPVGMVALPGFDAEMPFGLTAFHKIGVEPQFFHRKEYKTVMENFSRDDMSPANREMTTSLLNDITDNMLATIAADRRQSADQLRADMDQGVFTDSEALNAHLVDQVSYLDVMVTALRKKLGDDPTHPQTRLMPFAKYYDDHSSDDGDQKREGKPAIGLISVTGEIPSTDGSNDKEGGLVGNRIAEAFAKAREDKDIKIVVFRIDSPGGSPTASETIRRAVAHTIAMGKPVIVSMGSMAGSGGYWIAADANRIFALPATLTGSIGVASGKFALGGLMQKLGITWDGVEIGKNADMWSMTKTFNANGEERMNAMIDNMYAAFIDRVSKGRHMPPDAVEQIAKGRVWTGRQGLANGLVDQIGGLDDALDYAAAKIGRKDRDDVSIIRLPRQKTALEHLVDLLGGDASLPDFGKALSAMIEAQIRSARAPSVSAYDPMLEGKY